MVEASLSAGARGLAVSAVFLLAAACGDSGGSSGPAPNTPPSPPPPASGGPTWTNGVFQPAATFKDRCAVVRTGVDIEGNPFPDRPGSIVEENFWLRSWTHETYLWNDEVTDRNPANYTNRLAYFGLLKTTNVTPSGASKDQFHFSQPTAEFLQQVNSEPYPDYGAAFVAFSLTPPRDIRVQYTEPNSPASEIVMGRPNLVRGTRLLKIDGVDVVNGGTTQAEIDILNNGLFPESPGESHTFVVNDPGDSSRTVTLVSAYVAPKAVNRLKIIDAAGGKVGYILLNSFGAFAAEQEIADAVATMKAAGVADLVLDLRHNGGGLLALASQLSYMVAGPSQSAGRTFERLQFNADAGNINPVTGEFNEPVPFLSSGIGFSLPEGAPLETLDLNRVFVLTTEQTCSASESVINSLRGIFVDVILIGETTCGKPYGFYPEDNCGETYFSIQFRGVNDQDFGDYADGFAPANSADAFAVKAPGCAVADDYNHELGDETEALLAAALYYREVGSCPFGSMGAASTSSVSPAHEPTAMRRAVEVMSDNRDMRMPH